ncbi:MAG: hypothetical protein MUE73_22195, partial [Planctomycetes bacterium]|nr:hypothetical protein [Planctomycetota bacterium]
MVLRREVRGPVVGPGYSRLMLAGIRIPLSDGGELAADLTLPPGEGPWPAVLIQTPYGKERLGAAMPHASARSWLDFLERDAEALVIADWRGYGASPPHGAKPPHRGEDGR